MPPHTNPVAGRLTGLISVPNEIICRMLDASDWRDILRVRRTCRKLYAITQTSIIWRHLVEYHWKYGSPQRTYLERPISHYKPQEFEPLFLQWKAAEAGWKRGGHSRLRTFSIRRRRNDQFYLLTGGRWLLHSTDLGRITYYDLEAEDVVGTVLIDNQYTRGEGIEATEMKMVADMEAEPQDGLFKFNLVFSFVCKSPGLGATHNHGLHEIRVWQVTLLTRGDSDVPYGLTTDRDPVGRLPHSPHVDSIRGLSALGNSLAYTFLSLDPVIMGMYTVVFDWRRAFRRSARAQHYPWKVIVNTDIADNRYEVQEIHLLPQERLLSRSGQDIELHDYSGVRPTASFNLDHEGRRFWSITTDDADLDDAPASNSWCYLSAHKETSTALFFGSQNIHAVHILNVPTIELSPEMLESGPFSPVSAHDISHIYTFATTPEDLVQRDCINIRGGQRISVPRREDSLLDSDDSLMSATVYVDYESARVVLVPAYSSGGNEVIETDVTLVDLAVVPQARDSST